MSNTTLPKLQDFARRLLALEGVNGKSVTAKGSRSFQAFEKLRGPLGELTGARGFRSLLSRSLALASGDVPWLRGLHIRSDGSLDGFEELRTKLTPKDIALGEVALAVQFIGLLVTFIGPTLTLQLLHDVWPKLEEIES